MSFGNSDETLENYGSHGVSKMALQEAIESSNPICNDLDSEMPDICKLDVFGHDVGSFG